MPYISSSGVTYTLKELKKKYSDYKAKDLATGAINFEDFLKGYEKISAKSYPRYAVRDKEAGNIIDVFSSLREAKNALKEYEDEDKKNDEYTEDFYEIAKRNKNGTYDTFVEQVKTRLPKIGYKMPTQSQLNRGFRR